MKNVCRTCGAEEPFHTGPGHEPFYWPRIVWDGIVPYEAESIGIDIDDVLFPWFERAHTACVQAGITNGVTPKTWSPHQEYGIEQQVWLDVMAQVTRDGFLYSGDPFPGAVEALRDLKADGRQIHLVTARGHFVEGALIRKMTIDWLVKHEVPHDSLIFTKDKTIARVDVMVDDSPKNIADLVAAGIPCCMVDAPHNGDAHHLWRVPNLRTFADQVLRGDIS